MSVCLHWVCVKFSCLLPGSHNELVPAQVQSQLREILHSWTGELCHPRPQCWMEREGQQGGKG